MSRRGRVFASLCGRLVTVGMLGAVGGCQEDDGPGIAPDGIEDDDEAMDTEAVEPPVSGNICEDATRTGPGRIRGTLRGRSSSGGGACGNGGPDAFHRLDVPRRADVRVSVHGREYEALAGVVPSTCVLDWDERSLLCASGVAGWIHDVPAGSTLFVSVGIEPDHPALRTVVGPDGLDPLDYELALELRAIVSQGQVCGSDDVRCEPGTACLPIEGAASMSSASADALRCIELPADSCQAPQLVELETTATRVEIPVGAMHTDAHRHGCTGARTVERVLRLAVPERTRFPRTLWIESEAATGLAVRAGGCEASDEVACSDGTRESASSSSLVVDLQDAAIRDGVFVFVELPAGFEAVGPDGDGSSSGPQRGEEAPSPVVLDISLRESTAD